MGIGSPYRRCPRKLPAIGARTYACTHLDESIGRLGVKVLKSRPHCPMANAICERIIGTIRRECLDWLIPLSESHLRSILKSWIPHYNRARPHMALGPGVPDPPVGILVHPVPNSHYRRGESYSHTNPWRASSRVFPRAALHVTEFLRTSPD